MLCSCLSPHCSVPGHCCRSAVSQTCSLNSPPSWRPRTTRAASQRTCTYSALAGEQRPAQLACSHAWHPRCRACRDTPCSPAGTAWGGTRTCHVALSHVLRGDPAGNALLPASRCTWVVCNSRPGNELLAFQELHDRRLTLVEGRCDTPFKGLAPCAKALQSAVR